MELKFNIDIETPEFGKLMGKGGTSSIFKTTLINPILIQKFGTKEVALKKLTPIIEESISTDNQTNERFELALMASLQLCENIVRLVGYIVDGSGTWIVMKKYQMNLNVLISNDNTQYDNYFKVLIARDVSNGLKYIHSMSIIHLDLKPRKNQGCLEY